MADATLDHLEHDALFLCHLEPSIFAERLSPYHGSPPAISSFTLNQTGPPAHAGHMRRSSSVGSSDLPQMKSHQANASVSGASRLSAFLKEMEGDDGQEALLNNQANEQLRLNGQLVTDDRLAASRLSSKGQAHRAGMVKGQRAQSSLRGVTSRSLFLTCSLLLQLPAQEPPSGTHATATPSTASLPAPSPTTAEWGATATVTAAPTPPCSLSRRAA